jgi:hypothetical protein
MAMADTQQPQPAGTEATGAEAAAELAEIQRRQEQVIKTTLVPVWYWWAYAVALVAYGFGRDSGNSAVKATVITLAVLAMVVLSGVMIPEVRRRVKVHLDPQPNARAIAAVIGLIILVTLVTGFTAIALVAARVPYPVTIACAAGAAVLVIAGPLVNRYLHRLMLAQARQQISGAPQAGGTP